MLKMFSFWGLIRSLYFCLKKLPFKQAIKIPLYISPNCKYISQCKGKIILDTDNLRFAMIVVGAGGTPYMPSSNSALISASDSSIIFHGRCTISEGTVVRLECGSVIEFGDNFYMNKNCYIRSSKSIRFGKDVLFGWSNTINDTDGHTVYCNGKKMESTLPISIGNHVWITTNCIIAKGVNLPDNCIIAQGAIVKSGMDFTENSLIGGIPARRIGENFDWER